MNGISESQSKPLKRGTNREKRYGYGCFLNVGQCPIVLLQNPLFFKSNLKKSYPFEDSKGRGKQAKYWIDFEQSDLVMRI